MRRYAFLAATLLMTGTAFAAAKPTRFWNLTAQTVTSFSLAKSGTQDFGPDLCKADKDGGVDHDERLNLASVASGTYDAKLGYASGRSCVVKNVTIETGKVFSIDEKQLTDCTK